MRRPAAPPLVLGVGLFCFGLLGGLRASTAGQGGALALADPLLVPSAAEPGAPAGAPGWRPHPSIAGSAAGALPSGRRSPLTPVPPADPLRDVAGLGLLLLAGASLALLTTRLLGARAAGGADPLLLALWALAGATMGQASGRAAAADCRARIADGARVRVEGLAEARPPVDAPLFLEVVALEVEGVRVRPCGGTLQARAPRSRGRPAVAVAAGTGLAGEGRWWSFPRAGPWPRRAERSGVLVLESLGPAEVRAAPARAAVLRLRDGAQERLRRLYPRRAGVAEALLLARREGIDPELRERFARAGLSHLLAISGLHVGVIAGALLLLARLARLRHGAAAASAAAATLVYVAFLGFPHAAVRAALQATLFLLARTLQRPAHRWGLLSAAALALLVADPLAVLDPGFQLSFAGVAGLLALGRPLRRLVPSRLGRAAGEAVAASLAATLATAPLVAWHFGQAAPAGIVANLPAIPLASLAVPAVAVSLLVGAVHVGAGRFLAAGAEVPLAALERVAAAGAALPGGSFPVTRPSVVLAGLALLVGWGSVRWLAGRGRVRPALRRLAAAGMAGVVVVAAPLLARERGTLEIHAIDVGQGDALALRTPGGRWILVDAGPRSISFDAGRSRVVPYLLRQGAGRLDLLVITHPDADHVGGAAAVLDVLGAAAVLDPGLAAGKDVYLDALREAAEDGTRWLAGVAGDELVLDGVRLRVLSPAPGEVASGAEANEVSVVFRAEFGAFAALFTGDAYVDVERRIARATPELLRAQLLKVGHHGSATSTSEELLGAMGAPLAVISVGRRNRYGHPHPAVLERLERRGVRVLRTDRNGAITIRANRSGAVTVETTR